MEKKAIVLLADGFEEVEAVTPIDYLRRAGVEVAIAAIGGRALAVKGARGIVINADAALQDVAADESWDAVVIPGGMPGASNIAASKEAGALIAKMYAAGKLVCAICAAPAVVLAPLGFMAGKKAACYPGCEEGASGCNWTEEQVAIDGNVITSRAAGTAGAFSIAIIEKLLGRAEGEKIAKAVLC